MDFGTVTGNVMMGGEPGKIDYESGEVIVGCIAVVIVGFGFYLIWHWGTAAIETWFCMMDGFCMK